MTYKKIEIDVRDISDFDFKKLFDLAYNAWTKGEEIVKITMHEDQIESIKDELENIIDVQKNELLYIDTGFSKAQIVKKHY